MPVRINVTQQDIDVARAWATEHGGYCYNEHCPIAQAVCRSYGITVEHGVVSVDHDGIEVRTPDEVLIPITDAARDFINEFDSKKRVAPFSFDLPIDRLPDVVAVR